MVRAVPGLRRLHDLYREFHANRQTLAEWSRFVPPGHFYSPIPDLNEVREQQAAIFARDVDVPSIELRPEAQLDLLRSFARFHGDLPWESMPRPGLRYYYANDFFSYGDAVILYSFLRHFQPKRVIEIGSGFSSCVMLDTNERFLGGATAFTFVEPYPDRLLGLLTDSEKQRVDVRKCRLQDLSLEELLALERDDILFVDSSHVVSIGSDVVHEILAIVPRLKPGVIIHFHDIFLPGEYPEKFVTKNLCFWAEQYMLEAFLSFNSKFKVLWGSSAMQFHHPEVLAATFPHWDDSYSRMPESLKIFAPTLDGERVWPCSLWIERQQ